MMKTKNITAVIFSFEKEVTDRIISNLSKINLINEIVIVSKNLSEKFLHTTSLQSDNYFSGYTISKLINHAQTKNLLIISGMNEITLTAKSISSFISKAKDTKAGWVYSDYYDEFENSIKPHPLIDYQIGSIRDDFDFGPCFYVNADFAKECLTDLISVKNNFIYSGLYDLRLAISRKQPVVRISEPAYSVKINSEENPSNKMFKYVDHKNREVQIEMEKVATDHLKKINAFIKSSSKKSFTFKDDFSCEASIIIPVKNRVNTITDAINSALKQKTKFNFNVIVVDNHSTDGTTELVKKISRSNQNLVQLIPSKKDLEIGGCWNEALSNKSCGKFAVQLDSDDLYMDENTVQRIVDKFYEDRCAMVIGSYKLTDYNLNEIPPGIIDHREWTDENGHNNLLRVNGFGAPRAFYTPIVREIKFPNVSYGEDYATGLAISRKYKIGRIFEPIYLCRRWKDNTDAIISLEKRNANNYYKDSLRTNEIIFRQGMNKTKK